MDLDQFFKFKIGDWVRHKQDPKDLQIMVVDRSLHECSGGVQQYYHVRLYGSNSGTAGLSLFNEIELERALPPEATASVPALLQTLKELLVAENDFPGAAEVRTVLDKLKAKRKE